MTEEKEKVKATVIDLVEGAKAVSRKKLSKEEEEIPKGTQMDMLADMLPTFGITARKDTRFDREEVKCDEEFIPGFRTGVWNELEEDFLEELRTRIDEYYIETEQKALLNTKPGVFYDTWKRYMVRQRCNTFTQALTPWREKYQSLPIKKQLEVQTALSTIANNIFTFDETDVNVKHNKIMAQWSVVYILASIVLLAYRPERRVCEVAPIVIGPEEQGKSTLMEEIGNFLHPEGYLSDVFQTDKKKRGEDLFGACLVEVEEAAGMTARDLEKIMAMISQQRLRFRGAFKRRSGNVMKTWIWAITTNIPEVLRTRTAGQRRFAPFQVSGLRWNTDGTGHNWKTWLNQNLGLFFGYLDDLFTKDDGVSLTKTHIGRGKDVRKAHKTLIGMAEIAHDDIDAVAEEWIVYLQELGETRFESLQEFWDWLVNERGGIDQFGKPMKKDPHLYNNLKKNQDYLMEAFKKLGIENKSKYMSKKSEEVDRNGRKVAGKTIRAYWIPKTSKEQSASTVKTPTQKKDPELFKTSGHYEKLNKSTKRNYKWQRK